MVKWGSVGASTGTCPGDDHLASLHMPNLVSAVYSARELQSAAMPMAASLIFLSIWRTCHVTAVDQSSLREGLAGRAGRDDIARARPHARTHASKPYKHTLKCTQHVFSLTAYLKSILRVYTYITSTVVQFTSTSTHWRRWIDEKDITHTMQNIMIIPHSL